MREPFDPERLRTINEVLDAALDLPPSDRAGFLTDACGADDALRAEVESLLEAHALAEDYLEAPVASLRDALKSPLRQGQRVGPYEVLRELGRGGLGIVYLALDRRLGRTVALKVLQAWRTTDPEARARFEREARAASALDHPQICTIYEIDETDAGDPYIAMAHVDGETLKERIARGPLDITDAVHLATETARGLAHAHSHGIVHRDIKPANLIVTPAGQLRIVDFGLATWSGASTLTREGLTPGTVAYMSPEQIQGRQVDQRSDIWALGVVLYEILTGQPPFRGDDERSTSYAIVNQDPLPLTAVRAGIPLALESVLGKALAKDPEKRYQHVDELPVDLRNALEQASGRTPAALAPAARRTGTAVMLTLAAALAVAVPSIIVFNRTSTAEPQPPLYLSLVIPPEQALVSSYFQRFAISPDGMRIVYVARSGGREQLFLRRIDSLEFIAIPGTENARDPFFSPDGRWVGFFAGEELRKVLLDGGAPQKICNAPSRISRGATWAPDGTIILPLGQFSGLYRVSSAGGVPEALTVPSDEAVTSSHYYPQVLPDGETVLFSIWRDGGGFSAAILDLQTGDWHEIGNTCGITRYVPTGHLVCGSEQKVMETGSLLITPFELTDRSEPGPSVLAFQPAGFRAFDFAVSATGTLVYLADSPVLERTLTWVDREGRQTPLDSATGGYITPALSPDGGRVAATRPVQAGRLELWLYDRRNGTSARLSASSDVSNMPLWSPDADRVVFNTLQSPPGIYAVRPDLSDSASLLVPRRGNILVPGSFSFDGRFLAYTELHPLRLGDIWILSLADRSSTPFLQSPSNEHTPAFSSDGYWLAYASDESGRDEIFVRAYPGPGAPIQVSPDGGTEPLWSRDGTELFYRRDDAIMAVPVKTEPTFASGQPVVLFRGSFATEWVGARGYDVGPDGRFLMVRTESPAVPDRLDIVLHWFDELERVAPARR